MEGVCVYVCVSQNMLVVLAVVGTQTHAGYHRTAQLTKSFGSKHPAIDLSFSCILLKNRLSVESSMQLRASTASFTYTLSHHSNRATSACLFALPLEGVI